MEELYPTKVETVALMKELNGFLYYPSAVYSDVNNAVYVILTPNDLAFIVESLRDA